MRPHSFIFCLTLFSLCALIQSQIQNSPGPDKCCFSFSNIRIPLNVVVSYQITHLECRNSGIIFTTKAGREICADLSDKWVQRLKNKVDTRSLKEIDSSSGESP